MDRVSNNIKFHDNQSSGSWVVPCGRMDGRPVMTKLIVAFRNFARVPKNVFQPASRHIAKTHTYVVQCCHCAGSRFPFWCLSRWNPFSYLPPAGTCGPWRDAPRPWSKPWPSHPLQRTAAQVTLAVESAAPPVQSHFLYMATVVCDVLTALWRTYCFVTYLPLSDVLPLCDVLTALWRTYCFVTYLLLCDVLTALWRTLPLCDVPYRCYSAVGQVGYVAAVSGNRQLSNIIMTLYYSP